MSEGFLNSIITRAHILEIDFFEISKSSFVHCKIRKHTSCKIMRFWELKVDLNILNAFGNLASI